MSPRDAANDRAGQSVMTPATTTVKTLLSVVVPAYNEQEVLLDFQKRLAQVLDNMPIRAEIIYVNDGSTDKTLEVLHQIRALDARVAILDLSRNFGKEIALSAGLDHSCGDAWRKFTRGSYRSIDGNTPGTKQALLENACGAPVVAIAEGGVRETIHHLSSRPPPLSSRHLCHLDR